MIKLKAIFGEGILELIVNGGIALGLVGGFIIGYLVYQQYDVPLGVIVGLACGIVIISSSLLLASKLNKFWFEQPNRNEDKQ